MNFTRSFFSLQEMSNWFQFILDHPEKNWYWFYLSFNPNITWEIIQAHPEKPWDWRYLSANPNITWEIIQANPHIQWDWYWLSRNPMQKYEFPKCIVKRRTIARTAIFKE